MKVSQAVAILKATPSPRVDVLAHNPLGPQRLGKGGVIMPWLAEEMVLAADGGDELTAVKVLVRRHAHAAERLASMGIMDHVTYPEEYESIASDLRAIANLRRK